MNLKSYIMIISLGLTVCACSGGEETVVERFDYANLETIDIELSMEIGESEDYIPGQIRSIGVYPDGTILVADQSRTVIMQFDSDGNFVHTVSSQGGGPGELPFPFYSMFAMDDDSLLIYYPQNGRRDYYGRDDDGLFQFANSEMNEQSAERGFNPLGSSTGQIIFALANANGMDLINDYQPYRQGELLLVDLESNSVEETGVVLKIANQRINTTNNADGSLASISIMPPFPYRFEDHFKAVDGIRFLIARADSSAFYLYETRSVAEAEQESHSGQVNATTGGDGSINTGFEPLVKISWNAVPRPVEEVDLDFQLKDYQQQNLREAETAIGEFKPPFLDAWASGERLLIHSDTREEGVEIVVANLDGEPLGKFLLPVFEEVQQFTGNRIYTIHRSPELGHSVRVYDLNL